MTDGNLKQPFLHFREVGLLKFQKNCLFKRKNILQVQMW